MRRRRFLRALSATAAAGLLPACGDDEPAGSQDEQLGPASDYTYSESLSQGSQVELGGDGDGDELLSVLAGKLPTDMLGHVLIIASVPARADFPLLAGEGVVYRLSFDPKGARIKTRIVRTDDYYVARKVRGTDEDFHIIFDIAQFSDVWGARNLANTALVPIQDGRLLASYDMGRPFELDARTLHAVTPVGLQDAWLPSIDMGGLFTMHFVTAHPAYDPDERSTYAINYGLAVLNKKFLRIVRWDGASEPEFFDVVDDKGAPVFLSMLGHQIQVTKNHVVILDGAFDVIGDRPPTTSPVWVVPKSALVRGKQAVAKLFTVERECTHFLADRNDAADRVRILLMHHNGTNTGGRVKPGDVGFRNNRPIPVRFFRSGSDRNVIGRHELDMKSGKITSKLLSNDDTWGLGLWGQDPKSWTKLGTAFYQSSGFDPAFLPKREADVYRDYPFGAGFSREVPLDALPDEPIPRKLVHVDHESLQVLQHFALAKNQLASSPTFVPRKGAQSADDGYLVVTMATDERDEIWIFDATDLAHGPLVKLGHAKLDFPFTLHSTWMEELTTRPAGLYTVERAQDYGERLKNLEPGQAKLAREALGLT